MLFVENDLLTKEVFIEKKENFKFISTMVGDSPRKIGMWNVLWSDLLKFRYGTPEVKTFVNDRSVVSKGDSIWWRDLVLINDSGGSKG